MFDLHRVLVSLAMHGLQILSFWTPPSDIIEVSSSSYNVSIFSLKASSHHDEGCNTPNVTVAAKVSKQYLSM
jgi:hypothetical protein